MNNEDLVIAFQNTKEENDRNRIMTTLYKQNLPFIRKTASRYAWRDDLEDLTQQSYFGLVKAVERWKPDGGANFLTYAEKWIRHEIRRYLNQGGRAIKLPDYLAEIVARYEIFYRNYITRNSEDPGDDEIMIALNLTEKQLERLHAAIEILQPQSLSATITDSDNLTLGDSIADPDDPIDSLIETIQNEQLSSVLWNMVARMPDTEKEVIQKRYIDELPVKDIGEYLGLSVSEVRRYENSALRKMRKQKEKLEHFLEKRAVYHAFHSSGVGRFKTTWTSSVELAILEAEKKYGKG